MTDMQLVPLAETMQLGEVLARSGFFKDGRDASQAVVKVLAGREIGIGPIASMAGIYIVEGKVSIGANLMAAAVKRSGKYDYTVVKLDNTQAVIMFWQKNPKTGEFVELGESSFTMSEAQAAGVAGKQVWKAYPRNMLFARAISNGVRWYCPDIFGGAPVYAPEELGATVDGETGEVIDLPARVVTVERHAASATQTPQAAANDAAFDALPSASAERAGSNGKTTPATKHDPEAPWDDARKDEAVAWAMRRYPQVFKAKPHAMNSLDNLLEKGASEGMDAATIAGAWKVKCAAKQDELDAAKDAAVELTHDELDAQAAADAPQF